MDRASIQANGTVRIVSALSVLVEDHLCEYGAVYLGETEEGSSVYLIQGHVVEVVQGKEKLTAIPSAGK